MQPVASGGKPANPIPKRAASDLCQMLQPRGFSRLLSPRSVTLFRQLIWHLRTNGVVPTLKKIWTLLLRKLRQGRARSNAGSRPSIRQEPLDLQPGELVMVKSEQEILETLDADGKYRGLAFLPEMKPYCGRRFTVYKRLERIFLEESQQFRRLKHTVLLSGAVCHGVGLGCDRSCLLYWREIWLRRVEPTEVQPPDSRVHSDATIPGR